MSGERVSELLEALPAGLPADLATWLRAGLEAYRQGDDLAEALGLDQSLLDRRDGMLKVCMQLAPADSDRGKALYVLDCLHGSLVHMDELARKYITQVLALPCRLPRDARHMTRILHDDRAGRGVTEIPVLCPTWPVPDNSLELEPSSEE